MPPLAEIRFDAPGVRSHSVIQPAEIRRQLEKMLGARTFRSAEGQRAFLNYAVGEVLAGRGNLIKEYLIGVEVFGRGELFDPRLDPIVRTQARKLRARLLKYYETEGAQDSLRIEFPKGSYMPSFVMAEDFTAHAGNAVEADGPKAPPRSMEDSESEAPATPISVESPARWKAAALSATLAALAVSIYLAPFNSREHALAAGSSIAVLPFVNLDGDTANEFMSDGLTDDLIESLGQVPGLRVVARTSAFRFKRKSLSVQEIGQQLKVHAVLNGTVRTVQNNLRITAQLRDAANGHHLWSGSFERDSKDARSLPKEISEAVAGAFGSSFTRGYVPDKWQGALRGPVSPTHEAYEDYLRGRYLWNKLSADRLSMAIQYFQQAIAADPSFARAYTALADCYVMAPQVSAAAQPDIIPKIRAAASKALELDSASGEAHIDLAISAEYDSDWAQAEKEFKKGLELSPDNAIAHLWYAKYLAMTGRRSEVLAQRKIAVELDPVSPYALQSIAGYFSVMGRYDEAIAQFRAAVALEPTFGLTHQGLGVAYILRGNHAAGIAELQTACRLMEGPRREALLAWAYGVTGNATEARRILSSFHEQYRRQPFPALAIAQVYIGLGDKEPRLRMAGKRPSLKKT